MVNSGAFFGRNTGASPANGYWIPVGAGVTLSLLAVWHDGNTAQGYAVFVVWMPHSVLGLPRQRPARASSSGEVRLVHGMHPTDR